MRKAKDPDNQILCVCNFTPVPRYDYRIGVPRKGYYREILNSDAAFYGGGNLGNAGGLATQEMGSHGFPYSITFTLPPLSVLFFKLNPSS
jgi:1,4-alpha-glucan branching enzyme